MLFISPDVILPHKDGGAAGYAENHENIDKKQLIAQSHRRYRRFAQGTYHKCIYHIDKCV
jgi:hypothetical protein